VARVTCVSVNRLVLCNDIRRINVCQVILFIFAFNNANTHHKINQCKTREKEGMYVCSIKLEAYIHSLYK
jgi:hypothetical protein